MNHMDASADTQLAEWARAVIEEALVRVGITIHELDALPAQLEVDLNFQVTADREAGGLVVRSPGTRGRSIHVDVPV